jgi:hypothetical protein
VSYSKIHHRFLTFSLPPRHKDTKGHKGHIFLIPKIKTLGVPLCLGALVAKIRWGILESAKILLSPAGYDIY